jgi:hypothetical protein
MFSRLINRRKAVKDRAPGSAAETPTTVTPTTTGAMPAAAPAMPPPSAAVSKSSRRRSRRRSSGLTGPSSSKGLLDEEAFDFFLSHHQALGGDQCQILYLVLQEQSYRVWYDMHATDLTKEGMRQGIVRSAAYVLLLTDGVLEREFVQFEARTALEENKHIILLYEPDAAHGGVIDPKTGKVDVRKLKSQAPKDLRGPLFDDIELIPFERRNYRQKAMIEEMARRANVVPSVTQHVVKFDTGFDALAMPRQKAAEFARGFRSWILKLVEDWYKQNEPWSQGSSLCCFVCFD